MKKTLNNVLKATIVVALLTPTVISCKKSEETSLPIDRKNETESSLKVDVVTLKGYMSKLINVKVSDINYDEKTEQFSIFGIDQISRQELIESYKQSKNK